MKRFYSARVWILRFAIAAFLLLYTFFCLVLMEKGVGWWIRHHGDALDRTHFVLRPDRHLGWRHKANLQTIFEDQEFITNRYGFRDHLTDWSPAKAKDTLRILVLGPSSAVGWGVAEKDSYSRVAESLLRTEKDKLGFTGIEVMNASQIGFSSWQGLRLTTIDPIAELNFDYVVVAYGVNDIDRYRFYFPESGEDREIVQDSHLNESYASELLINRFHLSWFLRRVFANVLTPWRCDPGPDHSAYAPPLRVDLGAFLVNLTELKSWAKSRGAKMLVLTTPHRFESQSAASPSSKEQAQRALAQSKMAWFARDYSEALRHAEVSAQFSASAEAFYMQGSTLAKLGRCRESRKQLQRARLYEVERLARDADALNRSLRDWAKARSVPLVDAEKELIEDPSNPAQTLFIDPVHPSAIGHRRIAVRLVNKIMEERINEQNRKNRRA